MADEGDDQLDASESTIEFDISGKDFWANLRIWALADPTFGSQLLATAGAVAAIQKVSPPLTAAQQAALAAQASRLKALSSNTFGGPSLSTAS